MDFWGTASLSDDAVINVARIGSELRIDEIIRKENETK